MVIQRQLRSMGNPPSSLHWNGCPLWTGISVQFASESVSTLDWNTQSDLQ